MKHDVAMAWVKDLRENPDKQARGALFDGQGYCCLGRLCVMLGKEFEPRVVGDGTTRYYVDDVFAVLPDSMVKEAGLVSNTGPLPESAHQPAKPNSRIDKHVSLTGLNDNGFTFAEIADVIEQHWEKL